MRTRTGTDYYAKVARKSLIWLRLQTLLWTFGIYLERCRIAWILLRLSWRQGNVEKNYCMDLNHHVVVEKTTAAVIHWYCLNCDKKWVMVRADL